MGAGVARGAGASTRWGGRGKGGVGVRAKNHAHPSLSTPLLVPRPQPQANPVDSVGLQWREVPSPRPPVPSPWQPLPLQRLTRHAYDVVHRLQQVVRVADRMVQAPDAVADARRLWHQPEARQVGALGAGGPGGRRGGGRWREGRRGAAAPGVQRGERRCGQAAAAAATGPRAPPWALDASAAAWERSPDASPSPHAATRPGPRAPGPKARLGVAGLPPCSRR